MDLKLILAAGIASGTILLFAAVGEIFAERSGVLNLGVEGMMLIGAVAGFATAVVDRQPVARRWCRDARRRAAQPAPRHHDDPLPGRPGRVRPRADVPRARGWRGCWARGSRAPARSRRSRVLRSRCLSQSRSSARSCSPTRASWSTSATCSSRGLVLDPPHPAGPPPARRRRGPAAADALGVNVTGCATATSSSAGCWRASPGRRSRSPSAGLVRRPDRRTAAAGSRSGS